jgi:iron(III) transport system substrate-binding protein
MTSNIAATARSRARTARATGRMMMTRDRDPGPGLSRRTFMQLVGGSASLAASGGVAWGEDADIASIAMYSGADREKMLVEGAKKEGRVVEYGTFFEDKIIRPMFERFRKHYPFLQVSVFRAETNDVVSRIAAEHQAGRDTFDVVQLSVIGLNNLKDKGLIRPYRTPSLAALPAQFRQPDNYWGSLEQSVLCVAYNTNIVKPAEAPKTYEDLLDPKWRGMIAVPAGSTFIHWVEGLWETWGEARTRAYLEKLKANEPRLRSESARAIADLVGGGQIPIATGVLQQHLAAIKQKGAPVAWFSPDPTFGWIHGVALSAKAPHPHAALLWIDWWLSKEGAQAMADVGYIPVDPTIKTKWPGVKIDNMHIIDEVKERQRRNELNKLREMVIAR